jgi:3-hydroxyisobutyrate dehydrogenase-like beta-hydroxyacid dehydrogenase
MRIGFVGLGLMGLPMARNLLRAGHELAVFSSNQASLTSMRQDGAIIAGSIAEIAAYVDAFCTCRVTPEQSLEVFTGPGGLSEVGRPGLLCIDFATVTPDTARTIGAALAARGMGFLDAPISGGPDGATAARLTVIVGGAESDVERARPIFAAVSKETRHMGPVGTGVAAKLCNNLITITTHALLAEAMVLGVKSGIEPRQLYHVLAASSARSTTLERVVPKHFLPRHFEAAASLITIMKDLGCALEMGRSLNVPLSLGEVAMRRFAEAAAQGHAEKDIAAVILPIEAAAGVMVGPA